MPFSHDNKMEAMAAATSRLRPARGGIVGHTKGGQVPAGASSPTGAIAEAGPPQRRPPEVSFSIEKKVGDATLHVYGGEGQEEAAKEAMADAAKKMRGA